MDAVAVARNAILSGEVIEFAAKTASEASRLAIRIDSVRWKKESAVIKVYLTAWYYPATVERGQSLQYGPPQSPTKTWNGQGAYPNPNSPSYKPFPGGDSDADTKGVPDTTYSKMSNRRVLMKNMEAVRAGDVVITLVSKRDNIKLDKLTTYIFAATDLLPVK